MPHRVPGWHGRRVVGAVLALLAAAAAITATFLELFTGEVRLGEQLRLRLAVTGWGLNVSSPAEPGTPASAFGEPVRNGWALAGAGLLLLVASVMGVAAARRASSAGSKFAAALVTGIGTGFLAATTLSLVLQALSLRASFRPIEQAGITTASSFGLGFWLVAGSTALAIVATILAAARSRRPRSADLTTPRYGFPAPQAERPGPQFPAPALHWPGGEPYQARQAPPPAVRRPEPLGEPPRDPPPPDDHRAS